MKLTLPGCARQLPLLPNWSNLLHKMNYKLRFRKVIVQILPYQRLKKRIALFIRRLLPLFVCCVPRVGTMADDADEAMEGVTTSNERVVTPVNTVTDLESSPTAMETSPCPGNPTGLEPSSDRLLMTAPSLVIETDPLVSPSIVNDPIPMEIVNPTLVVDLLEPSSVPLSSEILGESSTGMLPPSSMIAISPPTPKKVVTPRRKSGKGKSDYLGASTQNPPHIDRPSSPDLRVAVVVSVDPAMDFPSIHDSASIHLGSDDQLVTPPALPGNDNLPQDPVSSESEALATIRRKTKKSSRTRIAPANRSYERISEPTVSPPDLPPDKHNSQRHNTHLGADFRTVPGHQTAYWMRHRKSACSN